MRNHDEKMKNGMEIHHFHPCLKLRGFRVPGCSRYISSRPLKSISTPLGIVDEIWVPPSKRWGSLRFFLIMVDFCSPSRPSWSDLKVAKKNKRLRTSKKNTHTEEEVFWREVQFQPPTQKKIYNYKSTGGKILAGLGDLFLVDGLSELTLSWKHTPTINEVGDGSLGQVAWITTTQKPAFFKKKHRSEWHSIGKKKNCVLQWAGLS